VIAFDYARPAATAKRLLTRFGQVVTIKRTTPGAYDPATGTVSGGTVGYSCAGAVMNYASRDIDGTLVQRGDVRVLLAPDAAFEPKPGDTVTLADTTVLTVINSRATKPAGLAVLYEIQARG